MPEKERALEPPPIAKASAEAVEVLRVWASPGNPQQFVLRTTWKDPGAWGLLLVDVARHVAQAYVKEGHEEGRTLARIREPLDAEWANPTDTPEDISSP
jgi:hypothetical protein